MKLLDLGLIPYQTALETQLDSVSKVSSGEIKERVLLCSHPPVVTLGRSSASQTDLESWSGETVEVSRGGRATYHGPNQQLIYPILDLTRTRNKVPARDVHAYLRSLENLVIDCLKAFDLKSEARTISIEQEGEKPLSLTGVWVGERKIASIGVAVKKWVTYHGVALNVEEDPQAFSGIRPCGFQRDIMTSMEKELGQAPSRKELVSQIEKQVTSLWG